MASFVYKPECYLANSNGFVEKNDEYFMWLSAHEPDNRMRVGNKIVEFRFIQDEMQPTRHMVNGKMYTSKKKFRDETKARGCIEVGNEVKTLTKPKKFIPPTNKRQRREDIKKAIYDLKNR